MFSMEEKKKISAVVEKVLLEIDHPEMPRENPEFQLVVNGKESWSWAVIKPNWHFVMTSPKTTDWNEFARDVLKLNTPMKKALESITTEIDMHSNMIAEETLAGNVVKEALEKGVVMGLRIAQSIIYEKHRDGK